MGSCQTNLHHTPIQHLKLTKLMANKLYVGEGNQYSALKCKFALMITMLII